MSVVMITVSLEEERVPEVDAATETSSQRSTESSRPGSATRRPGIATA